MRPQVQIDPNELIDTTGIGWQEAILAIIALVVATIVAAFVRRLVRSAVQRWPSANPEMSIFLGKLAGWIVVLLGIVAALTILGFQLGPIFLVVAIVGVILFLSARNFVENFGAGVVLQTENPFHIGDLVEIADETGTVRDILGRTTVIDTYDGRRVRIPNSDVLHSPIVNYTERAALRSEIEVGVEYGTDLDLTQATILETVAGVDGIRAEPAPEALVVGFGDSSIDFSVRFWHEPTMHTRYVLTDHVSRAIDREFRSRGIVIAFPQVVVWPRRDESEEDAVG